MFVAAQLTPRGGPSTKLARVLGSEAQQGSLAQTLLTRLGAASEASGLDRTLEVNTVKRTMSLFNQGLRWYARIRLGTLREDDAELLLPHYEAILREHRVLAESLRFDG